jgi:hypothetical protein
MFEGVPTDPFSPATIAIKEHERMIVPAGQDPQDLVSSQVTAWVVFGVQEDVECHRTDLEGTRTGTQEPLDRVFDVLVCHKNDEIFP